MPKMSPEERAELERRLAADDAAEAEPDYEVDWYEELPDGTRRGGRMPWEQARKIYGSWLPDLFADKKPEDPAPAGDDAPAKPYKGRFGGGRAAG